MLYSNYNAFPSMYGSGTINGNRVGSLDSVAAVGPLANMGVGGSASASCVLYLGAIPYNWDVEVIKSVVCGSGPVVDVRCMMDNASKNKGFCFVEYSSSDAAGKALSLLSRIKIEGRKKLRIELSKEGLRNPVPGQKPELRLTRSFLPSNVIIPEEMLRQRESSPPPPGAVSRGALSGTASAEIASIMASNPQIQQMVGQMIANGMDMNQISAVVKQFTRGQGSINPAAVVPPQQPPQAIPQSLSMASQYLPLPQQAAAVPGQQGLFAKDKVSETLASIPPGLLIELLSKLKLVLSGPSPNYSQAASILHDNPKLAAAAAQSLLLMGIIDVGVINDTMSGNFALDQQAAPFQPNSQSASARSISPPADVTAATAAAVPADSQVPQVPQQGSQLPQVPRDWVAFPQRTINKLMSISENEASLIVQVLKLSQQQINNLPENERMLANQIRSQYL